MRWSAKLGRFAGIDVYVHATFLALVAGFAVVFWNRTGTVAGVFSGLALIAALFLCVLLHEYGHALTARRYGIGTRYITLLPIGGVALLDAMPRDPRREIAVALAGPAVNLAIAGGVWALLHLAGRASAFRGFDPTWTGFLRTLLAINLALAVFNLLPAFPMDGGRVLRALLGLRMDRVRATRTAATVGRVIAVGLGLLGLAGDAFLILIAVFVWVGAGAEARAAAEDASPARQPASRAMVTRFATLAPDETLGRAVDLARGGAQKDFPVSDGQRLLGVLGHAAMLRGLRDLGPEGRVADAMQPPRIADAQAPLGALLHAAPPGEDGLVCVLDRGRLAGIVDLGGVRDYLRGAAGADGRAR